jgi:hypothetical protein
MCGLVRQTVNVDKRQKTARAVGRNPEVTICILYIGYGDMIAVISGDPPCRSQGGEPSFAQGPKSRPFNISVKRSLP